MLTVNLSIAMTVIESNLDMFMTICINGLHLGAVGTAKAVVSDVSDDSNQVCLVIISSGCYVEKDFYVALNLISINYVINCQLCSRLIHK